MKFFIRSIMSFLAFSGATYCVLIYIWGSSAPQSFRPNLTFPMGSYGHMYSRIQELEHTSDVDVLFLGSSHAYRGFDVRIFEREGLKVFNLGSSSQTPIQTKVLLNKYLDTLNPKTVVFEVYPGVFQSDGVEGSLDLIANDDISLDTVAMALSMNHIKTYNALAYGLMEDLVRFRRDFSEPRRKLDDTYIPGGYVEKQLSYYWHVEHAAKHWRFNDRQFEAFEEAVVMLVERGVELILVYAPITSTLYSSYATHEIFDEKMSTLGSYYNFNLIMDLDDSAHFYDSHHLNQIGVELFNEKVLELLQTEPSRSPGPAAPTR